MPRSIPRVVRRGDVYYFRMAVPDRLASTLGKREIKLSLRTCDPTESGLLGRVLSNAFDVLFRELSRMQFGGSDTLDERVRRYFENALEKSAELAHDLPLDDCDLEAERASLRSMADQLRGDLSRQRFGAAVKNDAKELAGPDAGLDLFQYACALVARAKIENFRILEAQLAGRYDEIAPCDPLFVGLRAAGSAIFTGDPAVPDREGISLGAAIEQFRNFHAKQWAKKTAADVSRVMSLASVLLGADKPIRSVGVEDVKVVRDALAKLPPNYVKMAANKGRSLKEVLAENHSGNSLSLKTQDKYFVMFRQLLIWAENEGLIDKVPGKGVKVAGVGKTNPAEQRHSYSPAQLQAIFSSPLYRGHHSETVRHKPGQVLVRDGKFWVPVIALLSGMRMGEIVQLLKSDVREEGGIIYFDVNKDEGKQIKTTSSKRRVPIHRTLLEAGLLDRLKPLKDGERIFADVERGKDGYYSHNFSKWWGRFSRQVGFKSPKTAFHSFRHSFRDALSAAEVHESISKALMGHSERSVHNQYGSGPSLTALKAAVDKIAYPVDLSFLHAKD